MVAGDNFDSASVISKKVRVLYEKNRDEIFIGGSPLRQEVRGFIKVEWRQNNFWKS